MIAAICAIIAYERAIAEEEQISVRVEEGTAGVAPEAINVPSVTSCRVSVLLGGEMKGLGKA